MLTWLVTKAESVIQRLKVIEQENARKQFHFHNPNRQCVFHPKPLNFEKWIQNKNTANHLLNTQLTKPNQHARKCFWNNFMMTIVTHLTDHSSRRYRHLSNRLYYLYKIKKQTKRLSSFALKAVLLWRWSWFARWLDEIYGFLGRRRAFFGLFLWIDSLTWVTEHGGMISLHIRSSKLNWLVGFEVFPGHLHRSAMLSWILLMILLSFTTEWVFIL